jgi:hypothetical protein
VDTSDHPQGEHDACVQEYQKFKKILEVAPVMNALD